MGPMGPMVDRCSGICWGQFTTYKYRRVSQSVADIAHNTKQKSNMLESFIITLVIYSSYGVRKTRRGYIESVL